MIIKFGILIALILGALLFVGVKMGEDINVREVKMFFFILYGMSIFTVFNIVISVYFFTSLRNKRGPPGPKGKPGRLGDRGDHGNCNEDNCLKKSLETIIVDTLEKKLAEAYNSAASNKEFYKPLQAFEKILICSYVNQLYGFKPTEFRNFFANDIHRTVKSGIKVGDLVINTEAVLRAPGAPGTPGDPVKGTSVFKIQELKKKINTAVTIDSKNKREKDDATHFLYKPGGDGLLNNIISGQITGGTTYTGNAVDPASANNFILNSENCA